MLRFEREMVHVEIADDGCGFDPAAAQSSDGHHYGLIGMRERIAKLGGELRITSALGQGTQVRLSVPASED
jgi:two-component system sensor histidine kinase DegS